MLGLPALSRLEKHIWGQLSTVASDEGGITIQSYGSGIGLGMANPGLAVGALVPAMARSRQLARRTVSMSNLHNIAIAVHQYAADHDGAMPPDLDSLLPYAAGASQLLVSPASGRPAPRVADGKIVGEVDYVYVPWGKLETIPEPARAIIAYERPENYGGKRTNVAFADGHLECMEIGQFRAALDRSETARRKAAGGAE
jgi:prepilin-type processing-associated H-X9-DG protein